MVTWIGLSALAAVVLFLLQGSLLQVSVAFTGEVAPKYGRAMGTLFVAGLLSLVATSVWGFTFGFFASRWFTGLVYAGLSVGIHAVVYRRNLGIGLFQGLFVALVYQGLSMGLGALAWYLLSFLT